MPKFGWDRRINRDFVYTVPGHSWITGEKPPAKDGYEVHSVAHVGQEFTRWTYRPITP